MKSRAQKIRQTYSDYLFATTVYTKKKTNFSVSFGNNSTIYKNSVRSVCSVVKKSSDIDNQSLRNLTGIDALPASSSLQKLKNLGFLEQKGQARATYYVATQKLMSTLPPELGTLQKKLGSLGQELVSLTPEVVSLAPELGTLGQELVSLPNELKALVDSLGQHATQGKLHHIILALAAWKPLTKEQFGKLLQRETGQFRRRHLNPMKDEGLLEYTIPDMINHPRQAYRITEKGKRKLGGSEK